LLFNVIMGAFISAFLFLNHDNAIAASPNNDFLDSLFYPINNEQYDESRGLDGGIATLKEFVNYGLKKGSWNNGDSANNWVYRIKDPVNTKSTGTFNII